VKIESRRIIVERDGRQMALGMDHARLEPYTPPATKPASTQPAARIDGTSEEAYRNSVAAMRSSLSIDQRDVLDFNMDQILLMRTAGIRSVKLSAYRDQRRSPLLLTPLELAQIEHDAMAEAASKMRETLNGKTAEEIAKIGGTGDSLFGDQSR
jgi:hypothetical protein